jgi:hypothetical protein
VQFSADKVQPLVTITGEVALTVRFTKRVVLPALLPTVPKLILQLGGGDPFAIACSVVVVGHLVDSSPLSTIGALCIASAPPDENRQTLFNQMLAWGLSMSVVGAVACYICFTGGK